MADQESMGPSTPKKDPEEPVLEGTTMKRPAAATPKAPKKEKAKKTEETKKTPKAADKETKKNPKAVDEETEKETEKKNPKAVDKTVKKKPEKKNPKTVMKGNLKRPAAKNAMKKPAAAGGSSKTHPKAVEKKDMGRYLHSILIENHYIYFFLVFPKALFLDCTCGELVSCLNLYLHLCWICFLYICNWKFYTGTSAVPIVLDVVLQDLYT